jgi:hypothetical protein
MTIELSTITFTEQDDIVPESGYDEQILNTGIVDTYAGNDRITGTVIEGAFPPYGFKNEGILNTADGDDIITGNVIDILLLYRWIQHYQFGHVEYGRG